MAALYDGNGDRIFRLDYRKNSDYVSNQAGTAENVYYPTSSVNSAYDTDVILNEMLIPNGITNNTAINYELTGYINDINTEYTQTLMEFGANGNTTNIYEYGAQRNSATINGTKGYYLYDGRGSVAGLSGNTGGSMITYSYDAYGNTTKSNNTLNNPYQYNAEYTDSSTGLQYLRARYYDSSQGRFTTKDSYLGTIEYPLSRNLYTYVENNPLNYIDPSGHKAVGKSLGASAAKFARVTADTVSTAKRTVSVAAKAANYVAVSNSPTATNAAKAKAKATYLTSKAGLAAALAIKKACSITDRVKDDGTTVALGAKEYAILALGGIMIAKVGLDDFTSGAISSIADNALYPVLFVAGKLSGTEIGSFAEFNNSTFDNAFYAGRIAGDVIGVIIGTAETIVGVTNFVTGLEAVGGGVPALVSGVASGEGAVAIVGGAAVAVAGAVEVGAGVTTMYSSLKNLYGDVQNYNSGKKETRTYKPNDGKHKGTENGQASPDPFWNNQNAGQESLNNAYSSKDTKQLYNVYDDKLVKFQPDNAGGYHAYEVKNPAIEVPTDVLRQMKNDGLITKAQYNKWIKNK